MSFYQLLTQATEPDREYLLSSPLIVRALEGTITLVEYKAFLNQAFHHVKHTVPLLMAVGSRLSMEQEWLREAVAEYIEEEIGHQEWILNDIKACGGDKEQARLSKPNLATELMVAYAYDTICRGNPLSFFGMVLVLEGTSVSIASKAADIIQTSLGLPDQAFVYLRSHGSLDEEHMKFYEQLMNRITETHNQASITHAAKVFYKLYGDIFRGIDHQLALAA